QSLSRANDAIGGRVVGNPSCVAEQGVPSGPPPAGIPPVVCVVKNLKILLFRMRFGIFPPGLAPSFGSPNFEPLGVVVAGTPSCGNAGDPFFIVCAFKGANNTLLGMGIRPQTEVQGPLGDLVVIGDPSCAAIVLGFLSCAFKDTLNGLNGVSFRVPNQIQGIE